MGSAAALGAATVLLAAMTAGEARRWWRHLGMSARLDHRSVRPLPVFLQRRFDEAGVGGDHRSHVRLWIAGLAVGAISSLVTRGGLVVTAAVLVGPPAALVACRGRGDLLRAAQVPAALDTIATALRGGSALPTAIGDAARTGGRLRPELETMANRCRDGLSVTEALDAWARSDDRDTALAGAALTLAASVGGPGADAIESAAASLRDRREADAEVAALSVQARLSTVVLTAAPVGFAFLLVSLDPTSARFLLATPAGWACIAVGATLDVAGAMWMGRLVRSAS
jgi:tight adherence protein B